MVPYYNLQIFVGCILLDTGLLVVFLNSSETILMIRDSDKEDCTHCSIIYTKGLDIFSMKHYIQCLLQPTQKKSERVNSDLAPLLLTVNYLRGIKIMIKCVLARMLAGTCITNSAISAVKV